MKASLHWGAFALLAGGLAWLAIADRPDAEAPIAAPAPSAATAAAGASVVSAPQPASTTSAPAKPQAAGARISPALARPAQEPGQWPMPVLARSLLPIERVRIAERDWAVLGTREAPEGSGTKTVLVLRDEVSGQLDFRQSALRFVLRDGLDYEAFIRGLPRAQRRFVNVLYGEVDVDAADIAAVYRGLARDPRVQRVNFIPITAPPQPR